MPLVLIAIIVMLSVFACTNSHKTAAQICVERAGTHENRMACMKANPDCGRTP